MRAPWPLGIALLAIVALATYAEAGPKSKVAAKPPEKPPYPFPSKPGEPDLYAKTAVVMDAASGRVLWSRDPEKRMYPASTTKILTTLLLLEQTHPDDVFTAPKEIKTIGEASLHLEPGEKLTAQNIAYAMMVRSANDACYTVAKTLSGSVSAFADEMNAKAQRLGCRNSHFVTPNGLHDPNHYTCALDLALIAREAMKIEQFRTLARTPKVEISRSKNQADKWLISKNHQLTKDPTCIGIKTGYTRPAGPCFVGAVSRDGWEVITVVLNTIDWQADHRALADWAFQNFEPRRAVNPGDEYLVDARKVAAETSVEVAVRKDGTETLSTRPELTESRGPAQFNSRAGNLVVFVNQKPVAKTPLLARGEAPIRLTASDLPNREHWPNWALAGGAAVLGIMVRRSVRGR